MSIAKLQTETTAQEMGIEAVCVNLWNCLLLTVLDGRNNHNYFFRTKYNLPSSKILVILAEIRLTKPHFDSSSLPFLRIPSLVGTVTYSLCLALQVF
jgi:hypothetical protein